MALQESDLDATDAGADANSFATLAEGMTYFERRPHSDAWKDGNEAERVGCMLFATILIERETFYTKKNSATQNLSFPLTGQSAVPLDVKHSQLEQALDLMKGEWTKREEFRELQSLGIRQITTRETQTRMENATPDGFPAYSLCRAARELLLQYMESTVRLGRA